VPPSDQGIEMMGCLGMGDDPELSQGHVLQTS
jgi:hypothetical protein